jgi:hypothetical protein
MTPLGMFGVKYIFFEKFDYQVNEEKGPKQARE